jgi:hypothetical protein
MGEELAHLMVCGKQRERQKGPNISISPSRAYQQQPNFLHEASPLNDVITYNNAVSWRPATDLDDV